MINQNDLKSYTIPRESLGVITNAVGEALGCYFEGEGLKKLIRPFGGQEETEKINWRREAVAENYDNYTKEIAESYIEGVNNPKRDSGNEQLNEFLEDDYNRWFTSEVMPMALLLPEIYITVSIPETITNAQTKEQAQSSGELPIPVLIHPQLVVNYCAKPNGTLEWICIEKNKGSYVIYDETNIYHANTSEKDEDVIAQDPIPHGFSYVPVLRFAWRENRTYKKCGHAMMYNVIKKTIGALTYSSMLLESGFFHLFPKLVTDSATAKDIQKKGLSTNKPIVESDTPDSQLKTRYLTMPDTEIRLLENIYFDRIPKSIYSSARLRDRSNVSTGTEQSGVSKAIDLIPEQGVLESISEFFEFIDYNTVELVASSYPPTENAEILVEYPRTFDVKSPAEIAMEVAQLGTAMQASSIPQSVIGNGLIAEKIYRAMLPEIEESKIQEVMDEINATITALMNPVSKDGGVVTALNGAQITAAADIVNKVSTGAMPRDSGVALLQALGMPNSQAEIIMGDAGTGAKIETDVAPIVKPKEEIV